MRCTRSRSWRSARPGCGSRPTATTVVQAVAEATGVRIQVISGEDEARLAYLAVLAGLGLPDASLAVFDTGGGSTQLTFGSGDAGLGAVQRRRRRRPVHGAVRARRRRVDRGARRGAGRDPRRPVAARRPGRRWTGWSGWAARSPTSPPCRHGMTTYDPDVIQGSVLERSELGRQLELYRTLPAGERRADPGTPAQARGRHPRRRVRRGIGDGRARRRPADGQRPRPPARRPGNAVRR